jgi:hypothetical protein
MTLNKAAWFWKISGILALLMAVFAAGLAARESDAMPAEKNSAELKDGGVAVVELFTSEGCSSCPPAEAVLGELSAEAEKSGRPIFALAFHVDYWNHLGWSDPFSSAQYSQRQADYSRAFGLDGVYTPQMVVNGKTQFVGSDRKAADAAIAQGLRRPAAATIQVSMATGADGRDVVRYVVSGGEAGAVVNVAVVERGLSSKVERGENAGRTLRDTNVVRWFKTETLARDGKGEAALPKADADEKKQMMVAVYLQRRTDMEVLGAGRCDYR